MMKKKLQIICVGLITLNLQLITHNSLSQNVGINMTGADPDASAGLDVDFSDKGVLIPRVSLTGTGDVATISAPTTSLLVYNTATAGTSPNNVVPGYYYWDGTEWIALSNTGNDWTLNGNSGTTPGTDFIGTTDSKDWIIKTNNTERMRVTSGGSVGIGTTPNSSFKLDVLGQSRFLSNVYVGWNGFSRGTIIVGPGASVPPANNFTIYNEGGLKFAEGIYGSHTNIMTLTGSGDVGIGTNTPSYKLEVCGTIGTTAVSVTTGISCSSDLRYKKNIKQIENCLSKIDQINGVEYNWKTEEFPDKNFDQRRQIGFVAQDLEKIYPELVVTDKKGYKSVDYSRLTPILVEAIKEQQQIIENQKDKIGSLETKNTTLENGVDNLNARLKLIEEHLKTANK